MIDPIIAMLVNERVRQRLSQGDVCRSGGISKGALSEWERGIKAPTLTSLRKWCEALGVSFSLQSKYCREFHPATGAACHVEIKDHGPMHEAWSHYPGQLVTWPYSQGE